jgi:hypothetical protein
MKTSIATISIVVALFSTAGLLVLYAMPQSNVSRPNRPSIPASSQPTLTTTPAILQQAPLLTPSSGSHGATDRTITENSTASAWSKFTNPQGLYSIQYPNLYGKLNVEYTTRGAEMSWDALDGSFTVDIGSADNPGRVEDWRLCSLGSAYPFLPVSVGVGIEHRRAPR